MRKTKIVILYMIMMTLTVLTGCGKYKSDHESDVGTIGTQELHLAAIIGSHANAPRPNLGLMEDLVYEACSTYGSVTLICDDGDPYTVVIDIPKQEDGLSDAKYKQIANDQTRQILTTASQMQARTAQVDTLKAIQRGSRSLAAAEAETEGAELIRRMVICDSCLSTTGALSFSEYKLNDISPDDITARLKELDEIPALDNVEVTVYTCGDTAGKQTALTEANRKTLREVWKMILEAGNANVNMKEDLPLSSAYDETAMPDVSTVTIVQDSVNIKDTEAVGSAFGGGGVISFDEASVAFCEGTAELANKEAAKKALGYVIEYMNEHPDFRLLICGTTAFWGGKEYCMNLSNDRANAVRQLLIEQGIDGTRLKSVGLGYSFADFYTYDQTPEGKLDETAAAVNRSVKMVDINSETAYKILNME